MEKTNMIDEDALKRFEPFLVFKDWAKGRRVTAGMITRKLDPRRQSFPMRLFVVGRNGQYLNEKVDDACKAAEVIETCTFLDDAAVYAIATKNLFEIDAIQTVVSRRYMQFYDTLHKAWWHQYAPWLLKIGLIVLLTVMPFLFIVSLKYMWLDIGLPLEAFFDQTVLGIMQILLLIYIQVFSRTMILLGIFGTTVFASFLYIVFEKSFLKPNFLRYTAFYVKRFVVALLISIAYWGIGLGLLYTYNEYNNAHKNDFINAILSTSIFPKVAHLQDQTSIVTHFSGRYAYYQPADLNTTDDLNCTNSIDILKRFHLNPADFNPIEIKKLSNFRSLRKYCEEIKEDQNASK